MPLGIEVFEKSRIETAVAVEISSGAVPAGRNSIWLPEPARFSAGLVW